MLNFTFCNPATIHFGRTKLPCLEGELSKRGVKKVLLVTGKEAVKRTGIFDAVVKHLVHAGISYEELAGIEPNPSLTRVYEGIELCRREKADLILAVGGGSVIDTAKAVAAGVCYDGDVWDFYRLHAGPSCALPIAAVLTIAGSGSEMNGNSVITKKDTKEKRSCSSPVLIPAFSILNPEFTFSVDAFHSAAGVADIMAHILENYLSPIPDAPLQDGLAEVLLKTCIQYGPVVVQEPAHYAARANILWASSLALSGIVGKGKISDWTCHAIEHELSGIYGINHGAGLAVLLPQYMAACVNDRTIDTFVHFATLVWGIPPQADARASADAAIMKTGDFFRSLGLPSTLRALTIDASQFERIATRALATRGKVGQYPQLTKKEIINILHASL